MPFANPKIARLYQDVPASDVQQLHQFRSTYPPHYTTLNGVIWEYIDAGQGDTTLLILTGALMIAESAWMTISHFAGGPNAGRYRVLAPTYPAEISSMDTLVDGIAALMDRMGIDRAAVMGASYGGMVAQVLVRRHPHKVSKLILSHTLVPDPARGQRIARALRWLRLLPTWLLRPLVKRQQMSILPDDERMALFTAYLNEVMQYRLTKEGLLNGYRRAVEFDRHTTFAPGDLAAWPGEVLLIMADDDPAVPAPVRARLQALYPQAEVHLFHGTGHATALLQQEQYWTVVETFLS